MEPADKLKEMIDDAPEQVANIGSSVDQIQEQIDELQEQDDAIVDGMLNPVADELHQYLVDTKLPTFPVGSYVSLGPNYNSIGYTNQLTDWRIYDTSAVVLYEYNGTGWDTDSTIIDLLDEWDFGNDYLTRPLTSGASYGIRPYRSNLENAKSILEENSDKIDESQTMFERFSE